MMITEYLTSQHHVFLTQLSFLEELKNAQKLLEPAGLKEVVFMISKAVEQHADIEEKFLFPELEPHLGDQMGPVAVMEFEHGEIRKVLHALRETDDPQVIRLEVSKFIVFLRDHLAREETVLFPMAQELVGLKRLETVGTIVFKLKQGKENTIVDPEEEQETNEAESENIPD